MPSLLLLKSPDRGTPPQTFPLEMAGRSRLIIGRQGESTADFIAADIVIEDGENSVSRHHAVITVERNRYYLRNVGRNDTYLNSARYVVNTPAQPLDDGDLIRICGFYFRFQDDRANKPPALPRSALHRLLPDPDGDDDDSSTIQFSVGTSAAQNFLDVAPAARLRTLLDISAKLAGTLELDKLLPDIAEVLFAAFEQADRAFVFQLDEVGEPFARLTRSRSPDGDVGFSRTIVRTCLRDRKACLCLDGMPGADLLKESIAGFRIRSFMCVPFAAASGEPLGAIQLDTHDAVRKFRDDDLMFLTVVAKLIAMAFERAQLLSDLGEVKFAKQVQEGFLPSRLPQVAGYDFFAFYSAAKIVGGDYYDFIELPGGCLAILVGDVSGKGVPASLLMAKLGAEARFCMLTQPDLAKAVGLLNDNLIRGGIGEKYVTLAAAVLDPVEHSVTVVTAGHTPPLRYRNATGEFGDLFDTTLNSCPLGWVPGNIYESRRCILAPGETLLLFTDGVTDAVCPKPEALFGLEGIVAAMAGDDRPKAMNSKALGERVVEAVKKHAAGRTQNDDIALVCFGRLAE